MSPAWQVNGTGQLVDPADRGLAYGDGLFETMAVADGTVRWLELHLDRLLEGCAQLRIPALDRALLRTEIQAAAAAAGRAVLKLIVTRGAGARGYRPSADARPTRILGTSAWPDHPPANYTLGVDVRTCALRLGDSPALAGLKHLCRLEQVLAQMELETMDAHEGLMLDGRGAVIGGTSSNIFAVQGNALCTPDLSRCGVRGVMRRVVLESAAQLGLSAYESVLDLDDLQRADEVFITNAVIGLWPVKRLQDTVLPVGPKTKALQIMLGYLPSA